jgi:hypothetical protein
MTKKPKIVKKKKLPPKAYEEGMDAGLAGKHPRENPYKEGSKKWIWWRRGWIGWC